MDIQLNFINRSNDANGSSVVIFQKNVTTDMQEFAVAWTVIKNCGQGWNHPFTYPVGVTVGASDSWGNHSPQMPAQPGQLFQVHSTPSGDQLVEAGEATSPQEVQILNALAMGAINANVYRAGRLAATRTGLAPQQKAVFEFQPRIWIGVVSQVEEGEVMNAAIVSSINTEISLMGIRSADIVMTGGGSGPDAQPFMFQLANVNMA